MGAPDEAEYRARLQDALGDDYELGGLLGRGGFGSVYAARDLKLERKVAVKALRHDVFPTPALLERFRREARAVAGLRHPNILPVHTVGEGEGIAYMVMPLVEGESLRERMKRDGTVPPDETVRIVGEVAAALEAAHKRGFVHRDVKPGNILLEGEEPRALLMDFGVAKAVTDEETGMTGTGMIVGSPGYMSPEQAAGEEELDGRSDIYSLGSVAYEMLTGRLPLPADSLQELVYKQVTQEVPELAETAPAVPDRVGRAVMRSLAPDPEDRWQTAADFRRAVAADDGSAEVPGEAARAQGESWLSRRGPYVALLLFLLFSLRFWKGLLRTAFTPDVYEEWAGSTTLEVITWAVVILLAAAAVDLLARAAVRLYRGRSGRELARYLVGQPVWWQTWYPRGLRVRDSVWDRLPLSMKVLRTLVWLELIVAPVSNILALFVIPTFQTMIWGLGREVPLVITGLVHTAIWSRRSLPFVAVLLVVLFWRWRARHGIPLRALFASLFNLRGSYWQGSPARAILRD